MIHLPFIKLRSFNCSFLMFLLAQEKLEPNANEQNLLFWLMISIRLFPMWRGPRGGSRIFFRRECTRLLLYFNTNKTHSFFFLQNTSCFRKPQVISGRVRTPSNLPLDPPLGPYSVSNNPRVLLVIIAELNPTDIQLDSLDFTLSHSPFSNCLAHVVLCLPAAPRILQRHCFELSWDECN